MYGIFRVGEHFFFFGVRKFFGCPAACACCMLLVHVAGVRGLKGDRVGRISRVRG